MTFFRLFPHTICPLKITQQSVLPFLREEIPVSPCKHQEEILCRNVEYIKRKDWKIPSLTFEPSYQDTVQVTKNAS